MSKKTRSQFITHKGQQFGISMMKFVHCPFDRIQTKIGRKAAKGGHCFGYINVGTPTEPEIIGFAASIPHNVHYNKAIARQVVKGRMLKYGPTLHINPSTMPDFPKYLNAKDNVHYHDVDKFINDKARTLAGNSLHTFKALRAEYFNENPEAMAMQKAQQTAAEHRQVSRAIYEAKRAEKFLGQYFRPAHVGQQARNLH